MEQRTFWIQKIQKALKERSVLWLSGIRRVGKTTLCKGLKGIEYFDCELPRIRQQMADPEEFLKALRGKQIVLDEIHRLSNPSELLKIAADHYPETKVIATGSSMLGASSKFKDTLTGRKRNLWLTPMMTTDLVDFKNNNLKHRFHAGGLPPFFLGAEFQEKDFQEWMDAYWAKDIQELFRLERRYSFQKFAELLFVQSGGIFEATSFTRHCEVSRTTIQNYLSVLEATFVAHIIRPFSTNAATEIVAAPKVYAFDTGFVCYYRNWEKLRQDDLGYLWEHFVLNEIHAQFQRRDILYWRDKRGHEIDFIWMGRNASAPTTIECKWTIEQFDPKNLKAFRAHYKQGDNIIVAPDITRSFQRKFDRLTAQFIPLSDLGLYLK